MITFLPEVYWPLCTALNVTQERTPYFLFFLLITSHLLSLSRSQTSPSIVNHQRIHRMAKLVIMYLLSLLVFARLFTIGYTQAAASSTTQIAPSTTQAATTPITQAAAPSTTQAAAANSNHHVNIGYNGASIYPYEFNASIGDRVIFTFYGVHPPLLPLKPPPN